MTRDTVEGLPVERRANTAAANEEFARNVTRLDTTGRQSGWDAYDVWRTRVRAPAKAAAPGDDRPRDPAAVEAGPIR